MNTKRLFTQVKDMVRPNWPVTVAGAIAWIIVLVTSIPAITAIVEQKAEVPTWDDIQHMPDMSSIGSSTLAPLTGSSGMQETLGKAATINQGDFIDMGLSRCTVGYIDHTANRIYIAGHCAESDTYTARFNGAPLGKFTRVDHSVRDGFRDSVDVGYITPYKNVTLGENTHTGNAPVLAANAVKEGDMLCFYGGRSKHKRCDNISAVDDYYITLRGTSSDGNHDLLSGDSGGPAWLVGAAGEVRGIVAVASHTSGNPATREVYANKFALLQPALGLN